MDFKIITSSDRMWNKVKDYAKNCSWNAGKSLADAMDNNLFAEWERVIISLDYQKICGYCTVAKTDCIPDVSYTPYIGYLFVGEEYRGNRLSQKLMQYAMDYEYCLLCTTKNLIIQQIMTKTSKEPYVY